MYYPNELYHHGILGMKWGIRRFQNPDGTLTAEGKIRYGKARNVEKDLNKLERQKHQNSGSNLRRQIKRMNLMKEMDYNRQSVDYENEYRKEKGLPPLSYENNRQMKLMEKWNKSWDETIESVKENEDIGKAIDNLIKTAGDLQYDVIVSESNASILNTGGKFANTLTLGMSRLYLYPNQNNEGYMLGIMPTKENGNRYKVKSKT